MKFGAEDVVREQNRLFNKWFTVHDIKVGNTIEMHQEARQQAVINLMERYRHDKYNVVWKGNTLYVIDNIQDLKRDDGLLTYTLKDISAAETIVTSYEPQDFLGTLPENVKTYLENVLLKDMK